MLKIKRIPNYSIHISQKAAEKYRGNKKYIRWSIHTQIAAIILHINCISTKLSDVHCQIRSNSKM